MLTENFIPYARQCISQEDEQAVKDAVSAAMITRGPLVEKFEQTMADYCEARYAIAFSSGSTALNAAYQAADLNMQDRVYTTPNTFVATMGYAWKLGARVVFIDIDRSTGNIDPEKLAFNLSPSSRGRDFIVPVHFAGPALDMTKIDRLISSPDTIVIEDAAHALGSSYPNGQKVGSCACSHMTIFSLHPAKIMTTGEGGLVTTNDETLYKRLKRIRNNGIEKNETMEPWQYNVEEISSNYNFTEIQAALGLSQFHKLESFVEKRQNLVNQYRQLLSNTKGITLFDKPTSKTGQHLFVTQIDFKYFKTTRTQVMKALHDKGIGTQVHYIPLYRHPFFGSDVTDYFPETEKYYEQALSLPLYTDLAEEQVEYVVTNLKNTLKLD